MPTPDMRPYAERLAKAWPEQFQFTAHGDDEWFLDVIGAVGFISFRALGIGWSASRQWAFWGPLGSELKVKSVSVGTFDGDCHFVGPTDLLEAIADAVCQEAERRAK